jgi:hypothetical protein
MVRVLRDDLANERQKIVTLKERYEELKKRGKNRERLAEIISDKYSAQERSINSQSKMESEIRQMKIECQNLIRRQELEYDAERERFIQEIKDKDMLIKQFQEQTSNRPKSMDA